MEKTALIELGTSTIRLTLSKITQDEHFFIYKEFSEPININEHIESDGLIKGAKIKECLNYLQMYKKIANAEGVTKYICVCSNSLQNAKNYKSFVEEAGSAIGLEFKMLTADEEINAIYTSVINTLDVPKGIIINIASHNTRIIHYNRRVILDSATIPYGYDSKLIDIDLPRELAKNAGFLVGLDPETALVGVSDTFVSVARLARKMKKYPVNIDHNYVTTTETFAQVRDFVKTLEPDKRLKGISNASTKTISNGICIIDAVLHCSGLKNIVTGCSYRNAGLMFNHAVPFTEERPVADVLGFSLETISASHNLSRIESEHHYNLALVLFKQLKVLHKLPRGYAKVLRIASYLYRLGNGVPYHAILNCPLNGATHKEIILAAFAASCKRWEDFNLSEWVRFKDIVTDEDLDAVRKISNILAIADALNVRNEGTVKDINCDILGDSVILKLVCDLDTKSPHVDIAAASIEIFYAKKYCLEFLKAFKKNLEIL